MKTIQLSLCLLLAILVPQFALADLVGPYTADANTLFLLHFDEPAGGTVTTNKGSKAGNFYSVTEATASATPATVTTMLGAAGYVNGATNFNNCMTNPTTGYEFGYDNNKSGAYQGDLSSSSLSADALAMTNLNMGSSGKTAWTLEALIQPTSTAGNQEIICTDNSASANANRGFQFRITSGSLQFQFIGGPSPTAASGTIPTTGNDAFAAGNWYHVAAVYDGTNVTLYWTSLNPTNGAAHILGSPTAMTIDATRGAVQGPLIIANENRNTAGEQFLGCIDEVRISSVARASGEMQFFSPLVTITANPVSQNIDYNQPVTFSVSASSQFALGYQWRFNSNSIAGATNSSYSIANVAAGNAGYYDCVVTNTIGYSGTSAEGLLVVGAANFLANRYSFTADTSDSIGGKTGTNFGNATVSGGKLVLDGTTGTYMQLPPNLFNGANATALTVEFWATFGSNPNNVYAFSFGYTNFVISAGIVGINYMAYTPHNSGGQTLAASPSDPTFAQAVSASGNLDGKTIHVACVIDPPNKTLAIYTNGVLEAVNTNFTVNIANLNDQLSYVGASLWPTDPYLNASIDELRIFKGALSSITIKQSDDQGPNTLLADGPAKFVLNPVNISVPAGQTATFTAAAIGYLPITYQWFKNSSPIAGATNASYSFAAAMGDSGATFYCNATNVIGVTTYVTNSTTATLTVFVPPTVAWLDAANGGADGFWNTTSLNWTNDGLAGPIAFTQTNAVLLDVRGTGSPTLDVTEAINVYNLKANATADYVLTSSALNGSLNGQGSITKLNNGKLTLDLSNNLSGPVTISGGTLQVGNASANGSLGSSVVTNNATLSLNRSDAAFNLANTVHGSGTLSVDGSGSVTISGNNDFSGSTFINSGITFLSSSTGLGTTSAGTLVANGAQLYITANVPVAEPITLNGVGDANGALRKGGAGLTVESGVVTLASDSTIGVDTGATLTLSNTVAGAFALTKNGNGTLALNVANSYSGGTLLSAGLIGVNANGALGTGTITVQSSGTAARFILGDGVTLANSLVANDVSPAAVTGLLMVNDNTNGTVTTVSGPLTFNTSAANGGHFVGPTSSGYLNVSSVITMPSATILSVRFGNLRFSGVGSSYEEIQVRANTTSLGANNGIATNAVMDLAGNGSTTVPTYFDLNGFNQKLAGLKNVVTPANLAVVTNSSVTVGTLTLDLGAASYSFGGSVAGNLSLVLNSGTQIFTGTNTYTGSTTVNGGMLEIASATLASTATVTVANGAVLQLDFTGVTNRVGALVLNGVTQAPGVYDSTTGSPFITGGGSLLVVSPVNTTPTNIVSKVNGGSLELSWPADHTGWRLQVQTNSLTTGLNTNWVGVPNSTTVNSVTNVINSANGAVFYRLVYP